MRFQLCVTIDVDPDDATFDGGGRRFEWRSLERLADVRLVLANLRAPATWFLRSDDQVAAECGSYRVIFDRMREFWEAVRANGHELGLHPHFCARSALSGEFVRLRDPHLCCDQLRRIHDALNQAGLRYDSIRVGESFHCTELMCVIDELGYQVDSTGMPGRKRIDPERHFDWQGTPNEPFHPSEADYRVPGSPSLKVLEIPMTTMQFKADFDPRPMLRYASLTYRPDIFAAGLRGYLSENREREKQCLVFVVHPAELDERMASNGTDQLYSFDVDGLRQNLEVTVEAIHANGGEYSFCTLSELADHWLEDQA